MATISPLHLNKWKAGTTIVSSEAREEFLQLYNLVNGGLDSANIADRSITTRKLADGAVTAEKIGSIPASKLTGKLDAAVLPTNIFTTSGGSLTGGLTFDVPAGTALLKNYDNEEIVLYEGGTAADKIKIIVGGIAALRLTKNDVILWQITHDGTDIPSKLKIPGG